VKVSLARLPQSRVQLEIEADQERMERSLDEASRRIARTARIPGFRPGKAPRAVVERMVGREGLIREALDSLVSELYREAIEREDVPAIGRPEIELLELDPVRFRATVPVQPTVELGEYRDLRLEPKAPEISEEMVEEQLERLRKRYALYVPAERPVQWNDIVTADVKGTANGDEFIDDEGVDFQLREGEVILLPGFAEAVVGMSKGESKELELDIPEEFPIERFRGKRAKITVTVREVKEEDLPPLDDDFAQMVDAEQYPPLDALRSAIREALEEEARRQAQAEFREQALDELIKVSKLEYPEILVEHEIDHLVREMSGDNRQAFLLELQRIGRSEQEYRESLRPLAEKRVQRALVLEEFREREGIEVTDEEVQSEIERLLERTDEEQRSLLRDYLESESGRASIRRSLAMEKTWERLEAVFPGRAEEESS